MTRSIAAAASLLLLAGCAASTEGTPAAAPAAEARGLWLGAIPLCGGGAVVAEGADISGGPVLTLTLRDDLRARLARETARLVGKPIPIRLDGRTLLAPTVLEPILGGTVQLTAPGTGDAEAIRRAAAADC